MLKKLLKNRMFICALAALLIAMAAFVLWGNTAVELNTVKVVSGRLPEVFSGYRIAHVSDLHNATFGKENEKLLSLIEEAAPDIIAITGDMIDSRNTNVEVALNFAEKAVEIAPCYYVTGNHEARVAEEFDELEKGLLALGVNVLRDKRTILEHGGETITLIGIDDPKLSANTAESLKSLCDDNDTFTVLLSHRPELFEIYVENEVDLTLSGHAHGGQIRLPLLGGIVAPGQGFFPTYDSGLYKDGHSNMVVSRGLGNSIFPLRVNNRPEVILIELEREGD